MAHHVYSTLHTASNALLCLSIHCNRRLESQLARVESRR